MISRQQLGVFILFNLLFAFLTLCVVIFAYY